MTDIDSAVAARIRAARERRNYSQMGLARLIGKPQDRISRIERCSRARLTVAELYDIAAALRVDARELLP